jgi:excisionase family DNA binding protein
MPSNSKPDDKPLTITVKQARRISGLGNTTLYALTKAGKISSVQIGRRRLIVFKSLEALVTPPPS